MHMPGLLWPVVACLLACLPVSSPDSLYGRHGSLMHSLLGHPLRRSVLSSEIFCFLFNSQRCAYTVSPLCSLSYPSALWDASSYGNTIGVSPSRAPVFSTTQARLFFRYFAYQLGAGIPKVWSGYPPGAPESLSRDLQSQNYFHNKTKTSICVI